MSKFAQFNKSVNKDEVRKQIAEASKNQAEYKEVPAGKYTCTIDKMELAATKDGRPMFKVQLRIKEGQYKKSCLFMNRVVAGTKNDMSMIASVEGWIKSLGCEVVFNGNYDDFADDILDVAEDVCGGSVGVEVTYNPDEFNSIHVEDSWDN